MQDRIREIREMKEQVVRGDPARIQKQKEKGKLTARERLDLLFDQGTFTELGGFVTSRDGKALTDAVITGFGKVDGRIVYAFSQDFTVMGGSVGEMHAAKICRMLDMARDNGCPVVGLNDSGGARIQEGVEALAGYGQIFKRNIQSSGVIPQISVILGPCAGGAVYSPALTDFIFMVDKTAHMFITGPDVIRAVSREEVDFDTLGGGRVHATTSGVVHFLAETEIQCLAQVRELLSYLPSNSSEKPPADKPRPAPQTQLAEVIPSENRSYDIKRILTGILDDGHLMEVHAGWAQNAIVGFGRLAGRTVAVVANQPAHLAGCLDIDASDKIARFVRFSSAFNFPIVTFVDTPGYLPSRNQEHGGIIRHGAKVLYAYAEASVPKISVIVRKAYGGAYLAMCSSSLAADLSLAWPSAEVAVMGPEAASRIIYRREIKEAQDPAQRERELIDQYREKYSHPLRAAATGHVHRIIEPDETRAELDKALAALSPKARRQGPGNIPL